MGGTGPPVGKHCKCCTTSISRYTSYKTPAGDVSDVCRECAVGIGSAAQSRVRKLHPEVALWEEMPVEAQQMLVHRSKKNAIRTSRKARARLVADANGETASQRRRREVHEALRSTAKHNLEELEVMTDLTVDKTAMANMGPTFRNALTPKQKAAMRVKAELADRELSRRSLAHYAVRMMPEYDVGNFHQDLATALEKFSRDVTAGLSPRLMIFAPPRSGKSQMASVFFPSWHLGHQPKHEIISCSYAADLANDFSRKVRDVMKAPDYVPLFREVKPLGVGTPVEDAFGGPVTVDSNNQNVQGWRTKQGGMYVPAGVGGPITGKGAHILIIDDPVKNQEEADSETTQTRNWGWYTSTAYTRLAPGGGVLVIQTRWSESDLSGKLEQQMKENAGDDWEILRYPAIAEQDEGWRKKGDALHPARYPITALQRIKKAVGKRVWQALYQQNPTPDEGSFFKKDHFRTYISNELPENLTFYQTWDLAIGQKEENDFTVGLTVGLDEQDHLWVVDLYRNKPDGQQIVEAILDQYAKWRPMTVGIERMQVEMAIGPFLRKRQADRKLFAMHIEILKPGRSDKTLRARSIQGRMDMGMVHFPRDAGWYSAFETELLQFPNGTHDDVVDVLAYIGLMMDNLIAPRAPVAPKKPGWRDKLKNMGGGDRTWRSA